jgi:hypothetical protein
MPGSTDVTPAKGPATDTEDTPKGGTSAAKAIKRDISDDPDVESIAQLEEKHGEAKAVESAEAKKELFKKLTPKKSLKEIEEEIARNTAKYDADTLKDDKEKDLGKGITKRAPVNKEAALKSKAAAKSANNINPTNITRLIRMLVIICFGVYKGERSSMILLPAFNNAVTALCCRILGGAEQHQCAGQHDDSCHGDRGLGAEPGSDSSRVTANTITES